MHNVLFNEMKWKMNINYKILTRSETLRQETDGGEWLLHRQNAGERTYEETDSRNNDCSLAIHACRRIT